MAINNKKNTQNAQTENETYTLQGVTGVREIPDNLGSYFFNMKVNGVTIYGMRYIDSKGKQFLSFPSKKGNDGKYYSHVWFRYSDEFLSMVESAIEKELNN